MSNATQVDLYKIARRNGVNTAYDQWVYYTGSVLPLIPGVDFQIGEGEAGNLGGSNWTLQVTANFTNTNTTQTIVPELLIIAITNGVAELIEGGGFNSIGTCFIGIVHHADNLYASPFEV